MIKKVAVLLVLVLLFQVFSGLFAVAANPFRDLVAQSAILAERDTGKVLFESNANMRYPADSLTKVMTLLLAVYAVENDEISDNELIIMTETAWYGIDENSTTLDIQPGEVMTFIDLMYSAYVGNANEACNMIALRIAGSVGAFVEMMNDKASEFGCLSTRFINATGQYHDFQLTTAYDQFVIFNEAMRSVLFAEIAGTFRHITESTDDSESRTITSSNFMLNQSSRYYYRNCISGRDSSTYEGGHSLIAFVEEEGLSLISVVLGSDELISDDGSVDRRSFSESIRLLQWAYTQFAWRDILKTTDLLARVRVMHGSGADFVNVRPETPLLLLLDNSIPTESFIRTITIFYDEDDDPLIAPVSAGDVLGEVVITRDGIEYATIALVANTDVNLNSFEYIRRQVTALLSTTIARNIIIVLALLLILYIALVVRYNIVRANRLRRIKNAKNDIIRDRHQNFRD